MDKEMTENNKNCDWCYTDDEMIEVAVANDIEIVGCDYCAELASKFKKKSIANKGEIK